MVTYEDFRKTDKKCRKQTIKTFLKQGLKKEAGLIHHSIPSTPRVKVNDYE